MKYLSIIRQALYDQQNQPKRLTNPETLDHTSPPTVLVLARKQEARREEKKKKKNEKQLLVIVNGWNGIQISGIYA